MKSFSFSKHRLHDLLRDGQVGLYAQLTGKNHFLTGSVVEGNRLGRTLGFPTINLDLIPEDQTLPANGVYAVSVEIEGKYYAGMANVGIRPTIPGTQLVVEANLFDFHQDIYGASVIIHFVERIREEKKFPGLEALKKQLGEDKKLCVAFFANMKL